MNEEKMSTENLTRELEKDENYSYRLINLYLVTVLIFLIIVAVCSLVELSLLLNPIAVKIAFIFGSTFLVFLGFLIRNFRNGRVPLKFLFSPFWYISFDSKGIFLNNSLSIPWNLIADATVLTLRKNRHDRLFEFGFSFKIIEINYIDLESDKMRPLFIFAWSKNFGQVTAKLIQMKNKYSSKNILCPSCKKELSTDAEKGKMIYSCNDCNKKYFQKIKIQ